MNKRNLWTESYEAPRASNIELVNDGILLSASGPSVSTSSYGEAAGFDDDNGGAKGDDGSFGF